MTWRLEEIPTLVTLPIRTPVFIVQICHIFSGNILSQSDVE